MKYVMLFILVVGLFGCSTTPERRARLKQALAHYGDDSSVSSQAVMSCGMKPISCSSGCGCMCIGGAWQSVCH